jgi:uncharacterized protein
MRWLGGRESDNVEDRRGSSGGGGGLAIGGGIGTVVIAIIVYLLGGDPTAVLNQAASSTNSPTMPGAGVSAQADDRAAKFSRIVLGDTEDVWSKLLAAQGQQYQPPVLVMFRQQTQSGCGVASEASGPFYCPGDQKIYIDLSFYDELRERFQAPGDFAMAYVLAHEVGHAIQDQLGILPKVHQMQEQMSEVKANRLSVRLELQADFFAGVWANHAQKMRNILEPGDIEEALTAANAIGDDRIQKAAQGYVVRDGFTHGSSAQRVYWFKKGFETGDITKGDTFNSREDENLQ